MSPVRLALGVASILAVVVCLVVIADGWRADSVAATSAPITPGFRLPWAAGQSHEVSQNWGTDCSSQPGAPNYCSHGCDANRYNCYAYDFSMPIGTPVLASNGGVVSGVVSGFGTGGCSSAYLNKVNYIYITHPDGSRTLYMHLSDVTVTLNQHVNRADLIGHSGQSGYACGPHLHFQRDVSGNSQPFSFDEYAGVALNYTQVVTSQNTPSSGPCSGAPAPGAGSSRAPMFQAAYDRAGGSGGLGCATNNAYWWCAAAGCVVRQDFTAPSAGGGSIIHDEASDSPMDSLPAWVLTGGIRDCYLNADSWLGPPMSDLFVNRSGDLQTNFRYGYIWWQGNPGLCHVVVWPNGWRFLTPSSDTNAFLSLDPVGTGAPNSVLPISGVKLFMDNRGGSGAWVDAPGIWIAKNLTSTVSADTVFRWTQSDINTSLLMGLVVTGSDGVQRKLIYGANASVHWGETGFVDMSGDPSGYGVWSQFARNIAVDYQAEFGTGAVSIQQIQIGHFNRDDWSGDHGGTLGGACIGGASSDCDADGITDTAESSLGTNPLNSDTDADGCGDGTEVGTSENAGGRRDPLSPYDFYDVPVPALRLGYTGQALDYGIGIASDVVALLAYSGMTPDTPDYLADYDGNGVPDGLQYDRDISTTAGEPWRSGPPDGGIGIAKDVVAMLAQVGDTCS